MSASSDEIPLSLSLPRPLQASPVCEALQLPILCYYNSYYRSALLTRVTEQKGFGNQGSMGVNLV